MRCAVCALGDAVERLTTGGELFGHACDECVGLLWEAYLLREVGGTLFERAELVWRWRRRRAEVAGENFDEPQPEMASEVALRRLLSSRGWSEIARELP